MGSNTLFDKANTNVVENVDPNQYKTALSGDFLPRNSSGVVADDVSNLGSSSFRWLRAYIKRVFLGAPSSNISLEESSGDLLLKVAGITVGEFSEDGFNGTYVKSGTLPASKRADANFSQGVIGGGTYSTTSTTYTVVSTRTLEIENNRPVMLTILPSNGGVDSNYDLNGTNLNYYFKFKKDGVDIGIYKVKFDSNVTRFIGIPSQIHHMDFNVTPGTYDYSLEVKVDSGGTISMTNCLFTALEL